MKNYIKVIFGLDLRSLALFRISVGLILIVDYFSRIIYVKDFYSDNGVLPRFQAMKDALEFSLSIHFISGLWQIQFILLTILLICAVFLVIGYKTRIATVFCWFLVMSIGNRNIWVDSGADQLLRLLLFWSIFLPLGARYSIDSLRTYANKIVNHHFSLATFAFVVQLHFMYLFTAIFKFDPHWVKDGSAVYYALQSYIFITPFGHFLNTYFSWSFGYLTRIVYLIEAFGFFFLYFPYKTQVIRIIAILIFISMHIGFGLGMYLGIFSFVVIAGFIALLPHTFWEILKKLTRSNKQQSLTIYYDNDCGFCIKAVHFFQTFLFLFNLRLIPAQRDKYIELEMNREESWIVVDQKGNRYYRYEGILPIIKTSPLLFYVYPLATNTIISKIGNLTYKYVAQHRKQICPIVKVKIPDSDTHKKLKYFILNGFIVCCLIFITWHNIRTVFPTLIPEPPKDFSQIAFLIGLHQRWNMFAPYPSLENYWLVIPGRLSNNQYVDLFYYGQPVSYENPFYSNKHFQDARWAKYLSNLIANKGPQYENYAKYLCRKWNGTHGKEEQLLDMKFYLMQQKISLDGKEEPVSKSYFFWWRCV